MNPDNLNTNQPITCEITDVTGYFFQNQRPESHNHKRTRQNGEKKGERGNEKLSIRYRGTAAEIQFFFKKPHHSVRFLTGVTEFKLRF